jgi:hypothetical protein
MPSWLGDENYGDKDNNNNNCRIYPPNRISYITVDLGYDDLGYCDTSAITLYIQWYQLISLNAHVFLPCLVRHTYEHLPQI